MSDQSLLNPGTSLHIEGADNQLQEEVEFQQEEQEKEKELRELLTNAFDDFIEDDIISDGSHDGDLSSSRLSQKSANTSQHESTPLQAPMPYMATTNFTDSGHATSTPMGQNTHGYPPFIDDSPQGGTDQRWPPLPQSHMTPTDDVYDPAFNNVAASNEDRHWERGQGSSEQGPNIHHYGNRNFPDGHREEAEGGNENYEDGNDDPNSPWYNVPRGYYLENYELLQQQHHGQMTVAQNTQIATIEDGNNAQFNSVQQQQQYVPQSPHEFVPTYIGHEQEVYRTNRFNQAYEEQPSPHYLQHNVHGQDNFATQSLSKSQENLGYGGIPVSRDNHDNASYSPQLLSGSHPMPNYMPQNSYETGQNYAHQDTETPGEQTNIYSRTLPLARQDHTPNYEDGYKVKYANESKKSTPTNGMGPFDQTPTAMADVEHDSIPDSRQLSQLQVLYKARGRKLEDVTTEFENYSSETSREIRILKHQLSMAQGDREGMDNSLKQCQALLQSAKGEITLVNSKLETTEVQLKAAQTNKEELIGQLNSAEVNIENLNEHLTQITQSDSLERARIHHQSVVGGMQQKYDKEIFGLKQKIDVLQEKLSDKENEVVSLRRSLAEVQHQAEMAQISRAETINRLNKSLEESQRQCQSLLQSSVTEELSIVKTQLRQASASKTMSDEMCKALQDELTDLREQLSMFESASNLGAFSVSSSKTKDHHDDSMADLGIKKTLDFKTPDLTTRSQSPDISDDYVSKLKMELERCLMSNKVKRAAVNKLQTELREVKSELNDFTARCQRAEKTVEELKRKLTDYEDEFSPNGGEKISPVEKRLRKDVDNLKAEKDILVAEIQELKHRLEEVASSEEKVNEINVELSAEISQMVKDYDEDKREGFEKCHTAYMQMVEDAKERVREETSSANQKERSELVEKYQSDLFIVKEELRGAWTEVDNAKELYIKLSEEKTQLEKTLQSDFEAELQSELEKVKTQIIEEKTKEFDDLKKLLDDEQKNAVQKAKEDFQKHHGMEIMEKIEDAVPKAKDEWLKDNTNSNQAKINSTTKEAEDEWKENYKQETEKEMASRIAQAKEEIISEKEKAVEEEVLSRFEEEKRKWEETYKEDRPDGEAKLIEEINQLKVERSKIVENLNAQVTKLKDELNGLETDCKSLETEKNTLEETLKNKIAEMQEEMGGLMILKAKLEENSISELEKVQINNAELIVEKMKLEEKCKEHEDRFRDEKSKISEEKTILEQTLRAEIEKLTQDNAGLAEERDAVTSMAKTELEDKMKLVVKEAEERFRKELEKTVTLDKEKCLQSDKSFRERIEKEVNDAVGEARGLWQKEEEVNRTTAVFEAQEALRGELAARYQEEIGVLKQESFRLQSDLEKARGDLRAQIESFTKEKELICTEKDKERKKCLEEIQSQCEEDIKNFMHDHQNTLTGALRSAREQQAADKRRYEEEVKQLKMREQQLLGSLRSTPNTSDNSDNGRVTLAGEITCHLSNSNCDNCEILGTELKSLKELDNIENLKEEKEQLKEKIAKYNSQVKKLIEDRQKLQMSFENMQQRRKLEEQHDKLKEQQISGSDESNTSNQSDSRSFLEDQLRSDLKRMKLLLKERETKWKGQIAEIQSSLEKEHTVALETIKKKMVELRKSHSAEFEKFRRKFAEEKEEMSLTIENLKSAGRRLTSTPVQTETSEAEKTAMLEVRAHYLDAVTKIREDVLQHVTETNLRAAEKIKEEIARSRSSLVLEMKSTCSRVVRNVLEKSQLGVNTTSLIKAIETHLETCSLQIGKGKPRKDNSKINAGHLSSQKNEHMKLHSNETNVKFLLRNETTAKSSLRDEVGSDLSVCDTEDKNQNYSNSKVGSEANQNGPGQTAPYSKMTCLEDSNSPTSRRINLPEANMSDSPNSNYENRGDPVRSNFVSRWSVNSLDLSTSGYLPLVPEQTQISTKFNSGHLDMTETTPKTDYRDFQNDEISEGNANVSNRCRTVNENVSSKLDRVRSSAGNKDNVQSSLVVGNDSDTFKFVGNNTKRIERSVKQDSGRVQNFKSSNAPGGSSSGSRKDTEFRRPEIRTSRIRSNSPPVRPQMHDQNPSPTEIGLAHQDSRSREKLANKKVPELEGKADREYLQYQSLPSEDRTRVSLRGGTGFGQGVDETKYNSLPVSNNEWTVANTRYKSAGPSNAIGDSGVGTLERGQGHQTRSVPQFSSGRTKTWSGGELERVFQNNKGYTNFQNEKYSTNERGAERTSSNYQDNIRFHRAPIMRQSSENGLAYSVLTQYEDNTRHSIGSVENLAPLEFDTETTLDFLGLGQRSPRKFNPVPEKPDSDKKKKVSSKGENSRQNHNSENLFQTPFVKSKKFQPPRTSTEKKMQKVLPKERNESPVLEISNEGRESVMSDISYNLHISSSIDASTHEGPMYNQLGQSFIPVADPPRVSNSVGHVQSRGNIRRPVPVLGAKGDNQISKN